MLCTQPARNCSLGQKHPSGEEALETWDRVRIGERDDNLQPLSMDEESA